jgi:predicted AlkP superfamily phosphohydrolase/phosphomutase
LVSPHGPQPVDGCFAVNQWLIQEGLLVLNEYPREPTAFEELNVNWSTTKVWSEDDFFFFNVQGREPQGVVPASEYEAFQNHMKARLEALPAFRGRALKSQVFKPAEIYRHARNVAPDLIVQPGEHWRLIGTVGHAELHMCANQVPESQDGGSHLRHGSFILTAPNSPLSGEYEGAHLLDIAPTLLDLAGYKIPETMQGRSLVAGMAKKGPGNGSDEESQKIVHDRLAGLGYV